MIAFIKQCGPFFFPLFFISLTVIYLTIRRIVDIQKPESINLHAFTRGLNGILFWGLFSAVLGVLGQVTAIYKSLSIILTADVINPRFIAMGIRESFSTTLFGFTLLLVAGVIWFLLLSRFRKIQTTTIH